MSQIYTFLFLFSDLSPSQLFPPAFFLLVFYLPLFLFLHLFFLSYPPTHTNTHML